MRQKSCCRTRTTRPQVRWPANPVDLWSIGCILAELLGRRPLFKGRDYVDQLNQILHHLGTPPQDKLEQMASPRALEYINSLPRRAPIPFEKLYPDANPLALDLLRRLLAFDPADRITCDEALQHPYLAVWHDPADEIVCATKFDFAFEQADDVDCMKKMILNEVIDFRREVRVQAQARQEELAREAEPWPALAPSAEAPVLSPYATPTSATKSHDSLHVASRSEINATEPGQVTYNIMGESVTPQGSSAEECDQVVAEPDAMEDPYESLDRQLCHYRT